MSFPFFQRIITLPLILLWTSIQYVTAGTRFQKHEAFQRSLLLNLVCMTILHMSSGTTLRDIKLCGIDHLFDILGRNENELNPLGSIPNYGKVFTRKNTEKNIPDSAWLAKHPQMGKEDFIIIHLHGGMMSYPYTKYNIFAFSSLYSLFLKNGLKPPSILLVDYSLMPEGRTYPTQILECVSVYEKLVSLGYRKIILIGDSAGGNLALSMLYHLNEKSKSENIVWPSGVALISPWLDLTNAKKAKSYVSNAYTDFMSFEVLQKFGREYFGQNEHLYSLPSTNINLNFCNDFWSEIPTFKLGNFLLLVGENEVLRDEILEWSFEKSSFGKKYPERILIEKNGIHNGIFVTETPFLYLNRITLEEWSQKFGVNALYKFLKEIYEKG
ncbi:hypothetical protein SPOG_03629 [Schizosaccharomyces cryophilus OY26]|uniref:Esterase/lipase n=1 Tax=Schizosaccharomyces cryophilus (strain OY26 / ATCC MYA-4695 / CBS 11777 / NBRC 106824 / NRRL Y48691) TaxID=653667 RepID=S9W3F6_SCHCR|nr:uncharacterized protein SPOG_03629 [Schizosaccharomyces cryophilus OY26]EPY53084.1 hypothetical protein SPOG_03629 [Schizosaccharomyces cryophilus OY26]